MFARTRPGGTAVKTVTTAKTGHVGGGGGGGRTGGGGGAGHESERAGSANVLRMDLDDFFGVFPFAGPSVSLRSVVMFALRQTVGLCLCKYFGSR